MLGLKDMAGLLKAACRLRPDPGAERGNRPAGPLPHPRHLRGIAGATILAAECCRGRCVSMRRWIRVFRRYVATLFGFDRRGAAPPSATPGSIRRRSGRSPTTGSRCASNMQPSRRARWSRRSEVYLHEMPGGQFTNLKAQARKALGWRSVGTRSRKDLCRRQPDVRRYRQGDALPPRWSATWR